MPNLPTLMLTSSAFTFTVLLDKLPAAGVLKCFKLRFHPQLASQVAGAQHGGRWLIPPGPPSVLGCVVFIISLSPWCFLPPAPFLEPI